MCVERPLLLLLALAVAAASAAGCRDAHPHPEDATHAHAGGDDAPAAGRGDDDHDDAGPHHHDGAEAAAGARRVPLDGVRGVEVATVGEPIEEGVWRPAEAVADEAERVALAAPVAGVVSAIPVAPGREVAAGTALLAIRSPEAADLTATLLARRAAREQAAAELAREERLAAAGAGAARELEAARAALAIARAEEEAARLALEARGLPPGGAGATVTLRAPRRGRVGAWHVLAGEGVAAAQTLGTFETGSASLVAVELPPPGPPAWEPGAAAVVRRSDGASWQAVVEGLPASVSPTTQRLRYRLRLQGGEPPLAGTPLEVRVPLATGVVVPQDAVQQLEGEWGVFVVGGDEAVFTPVRRGPELGGDVLVLEGLAPGQRVATAGAYLLKALALKQSGGGETHAH